MLRRHNALNFPGSLHFVTTVTAVRGAWFTSDEVCKRILEVFEQNRKRYGLLCLGYVLMPDHVHAILYQPNDSANVSRFMRRFKSETAFLSKPTAYPGEPLWRRRFDDVSLPGMEAVMTRLRYVHGNPVRRGIVTQPEEFQWSSAKAYYGGEHGVVEIAFDFLNPCILP